VDARVEKEEELVRTHCDLMEAQVQQATARCDLRHARTHYLIHVDGQRQRPTTGENINLYLSERLGDEYDNQPSFVPRCSRCRRQLWPGRLLPPTQHRRR
jgi:hypothetical protein